jgi:ATP-binding cassette, subfamily C (CFTR/MRP), member 4
MEKGSIIYDGTFNELKDNSYFKMILEHMEHDENLENEKDEEIYKNLGSTRGIDEEPKNFLSRKSSSITNDENEEDAIVEWHLYLRYFLYNKISFLLFLVVVILMGIAQASNVAFDVFLLKWIKNVSETKKNNPELFTFVIVFSVLFMVLVVSFIYLSFKFSIVLSKSFFNDINESVLKAPINLYFDKNPTGVILNRFSKDINRVDNAMP